MCVRVDLIGVNTYAFKHMYTLYCICIIIYDYIYMHNHNIHLWWCLWQQCSENNSNTLTIETHTFQLGGAAYNYTGPWLPHGRWFPHKEKTPQQWTSHKHFPVHFFINHGQSLMSPAKTTKSCCVKERCESGTLLILTDFYLLVETGGTGSVDQLTFPRAFGERSLHQPHETPRTWE